MTTKISEDAVMDAVLASRPDPDAIDREWGRERREDVLGRVLSAGRDDVVLRRKRPVTRRWGIAIAAAALVAAGAMFTQVLVPSGSSGSPQAAAALGRLADAVAAAPVIPDGSYERVVNESTGVADGDDDGAVSWSAVRTTWTAADGWSWAHQTGNEAYYYIFAPVGRDYDLSAAPTDPGAMEAYLRERVSGSTSVEEAMFEAVRETLMFTPTPAATRSAAIRMLARIRGVTVTEDVTDPDGRQATRVEFVDEKHRPGQMNVMYLDPATTQLLATQVVLDDEVQYTDLYTERVIVPALPDEIVEVLGTDRVEKTVP